MINELPPLECNIDISNLIIEPLNYNNSYIIIGQKQWQQITHLHLPSYYNGKQITNIADNAFANRDIQTLQLPKHIMQIGNSAFRGNDLRELDLSPYERLQAIEKEAFAHNRNLAILKLGSNLSLINDHAFAYSGIFQIDFKEVIKLETIGTGAFQNNNINSIYINGLTKLKTIMPQAFLNNQIGEIELRNLPSLINVGYEAFRNNQIINKINLINLNMLIYFDIKAFSGSTQVERLTYSTYTNQWPKWWDQRNNIFRRFTGETIFNINLDKE